MPEVRLIDANAAADKIMHDVEVHADEIGIGAVAIMIAFARALRDETDFPTIEQEVRHGDWIFCKVRQPDKDGLYLVTYERYFTPDHIDEIDHVTDIGIKRYFADSYGWGLEKVHAWRNLPDMAIIGDEECINK